MDNQSNKRKVILYQILSFLIDVETFAWDITELFIKPIKYARYLVLKKIQNEK